MYFLGDVHAESPLMRDFLNSEEKYCLQLGDFGFIFKYNDWKWNRFLNHFEKNYPNKMIFTVLGNHENYDSIEKMPVKDMFGARCRKIRSNVYAIERGEILSIEGLNILCIGGADSIDKAWRQDGISWWAQEKISDADVKKTVEKGLTCSFDMVCSHAMPAFFMLQNFTPCFQTGSEFSLEKIYCDIENNGGHIPLWIGGHVHSSINMMYNDTLFRSLDIGEKIIYHKDDSIEDKFLIH